MRDLNVEGCVNGLHSVNVPKLEAYRDAVLEKFASLGVDPPRRSKPFSPTSVGVTFDERGFRQWLASVGEREPADSLSALSESEAKSFIDDKMADAIELLKRIYATIIKILG